MDNMTIINAQYCQGSNGVNSCIKATIDGTELFVPLKTGNSHYAGIVAATATDGSFWGDTVPEPMATEAATWLFNQQLAAYRTATARLAQYIVSVGRAEVVESQATGEQVWDEDTMEMVDVMHDVTTVTEVEPVEATVTRLVYDETDHMAEPTEETIENPVITTDVAERADAQAVVDGTPAAVVAAA
tara:strand:- start:122 stop:682 length:561 start_codon:yes stop_codon:yes gene_type:complete